MKSKRKEEMYISQKTNKEIFKGLCTNCENRENCMYVTKSRTVNYCEEYG